MKNNSLKLILFIAVAIVGLTFILNSQKKTKEIRQQLSTPYVEGEVLVKFKSGTPQRVVLSFKEKLQVKEEHFTESISVYQWKGDFKTEEALKLLRASSAIQYAEPNYQVSIRR